MAELDKYLQQQQEATDPNEVQEPTVVDEASVASDGDYVENNRKNLKTYLEQNGYSTNIDTEDGLRSAFTNMKAKGDIDGEYEDFAKHHRLKTPDPVAVDKAEEKTTPVVKATKETAKEAISELKPQGNALQQNAVQQTTEQQTEQQPQEKVVQPKTKEEYNQLRREQIKSTRQGMFQMVTGKDATQNPTEYEEWVNGTLLNSDKSLNMDYVRQLREQYVKNTGKTDVTNDILAKALAFSGKGYLDEEYENFKQQEREQWHAYEAKQKEYQQQLEQNRTELYDNLKLDGGFTMTREEFDKALDDRDPDKIFEMMYAWKNNHDSNNGFEEKLYGVTDMSDFMRGDFGEDATYMRHLQGMQKARFVDEDGNIQYTYIPLWNILRNPEAYAGVDFQFYDVKNAKKYQTKEGEIKNNVKLKSERWMSAQQLAELVNEGDYVKWFKEHITSKETGDPISDETIQGWKKWTDLANREVKNDITKKVDEMYDEIRKKRANEEYSHHNGYGVHSILSSAVANNEMANEEEEAIPQKMKEWFDGLSEEELQVWYKKTGYTNRKDLYDKYINPLTENELNNRALKTVQKYYDNGGAYMESGLIGSTYMMLVPMSKRASEIKPFVQYQWMQDHPVQKHAAEAVGIIQDIPLYYVGGEIANYTMRAAKALRTGYKYGRLFGEDILTSASQALPRAFQTTSSQINRMMAMSMKNSPFTYSMTHSALTLGSIENIHMAMEAINGEDITFGDWVWRNVKSGIISGVTLGFGGAVSRKIEENIGKAITRGDYAKLLGSKATGVLIGGSSLTASTYISGAIEYYNAVYHLHNDKNLTSEQIQHYKEVIANTPTLQDFWGIFGNSCLMDVQFKMFGSVKGAMNEIKTTGGALKHLIRGVDDVKANYLKAKQSMDVNEWARDMELSSFEKEKIHNLGFKAETMEELLIELYGGVDKETVKSYAKRNNISVKEAEAKLNDLVFAKFQADGRANTLERDIDSDLALASFVTLNGDKQVNIDNIDKVDVIPQSLAQRVCFLSTGKYFVGGLTPTFGKVVDNKVYLMGGSNEKGTGFLHSVKEFGTNEEAQKYFDSINGELKSNRLSTGLDNYSYSVFHGAFTMNEEELNKLPEDMKNDVEAMKAYIMEHISQEEQSTIQKILQAKDGGAELQLTESDKKAMEKYWKVCGDAQKNVNEQVFRKMASKNGLSEEQIEKALKFNDYSEIDDGKLDKILEEQGVFAKTFADINQPYRDILKGAEESLNKQRAVIEQGNTGKNADAGQTPSQEPTVGNEEADAVQPTAEQQRQTQIDDAVITRVNEAREQARQNFEAQHRKQGHISTNENGEEVILMGTRRVGDSNIPVFVSKIIPTEKGMLAVLSKDSGNIEIPLEEISGLASRRVEDLINDQMVSMGVDENSIRAEEEFKASHHPETRQATIGQDFTMSDGKHYIVVGENNGRFVVKEAEYDTQSGRYVEKAKSSPVEMSGDEIASAQDKYYNVRDGIEPSEEQAKVMEQEVAKKAETMQIPEDGKVFKMVGVRSGNMNEEPTNYVARKSNGIYVVREVDAEGNPVNGGYKFVSDEQSLREMLAKNGVEESRPETVEEAPKDGEVFYVKDDITGQPMAVSRRETPAGIVVEEMEQDADGNWVVRQNGQKFITDENTLNALIDEANMEQQKAVEEKAKQEEKASTIPVDTQDKTEFERKKGSATWAEKVVNPERLKKNDKGAIDFENNTVDDVLGFMYNPDRYTEAEGNRWLNMHKERAQKELAKFNDDTAPKQEDYIDDPEAYSKAKDEYEAQRAEAERKVKFWNDVEAKRDKVKGDYKAAEAMSKAIGKNAKEGRASVIDIDENGRPYVNNTKPKVGQVVGAEHLSDIDAGNINRLQQEAKAMGVGIIIHNNDRVVGADGELTLYDGFYEDNVVHLSKINENPLGWVRGHEYTHSLRNDKNGALEAYISQVQKELEAIPSTDKRFSNKWNELWAKKKRFKYSEADIPEEIAADYAGDMVLDHEYAQKVFDLITDKDAEKRADMYLEDAQREASILKSFADLAKKLVPRKKQIEALPEEQQAEVQKEVTAKDLWANALKEHAKLVRSRNFASNGKGEEVGMKGNGEIVVDAKMSKKTYQPFTDNLGVVHEGTREAAISYMKERNFSQEQIDEFTDRMDWWYNYLDNLEKMTNEDGSLRYQQFVDWNKTTPQYKSVGVKMEKVLSSLVSNGEYPVNVELSTDCIKREAFTQLLNRLATIDDGSALKNLNPGEITAIQNMMESYGLQTACKLCFVEGKRLQIRNWAETIANDWNCALNEVLDLGVKSSVDNDGKRQIDANAVSKAMQEKYGVDDAFFGFGQGDYVPETSLDDMPSVTDANSVERVAMLKNINNVYDLLSGRKGDKGNSKVMKLVEENAKKAEALAMELENSWRQSHPDEADYIPTKKDLEAIKKQIDKGIKKVYDQMVEAIAQNPELAKVMTINDLVGSKGLDAIRSGGEAFDTMFSLIKARFGTGTPKVVQRAEPYDGELLDVGKLSDKDMEKANAIGGSRMFSFSDFDLTKVFDIMQIFGDCELRGTKLQSYSKEIPYVLLFGKNTNAKINISTLVQVTPEAELLEQYRSTKNKKQREAIKNKINEYAGLVRDENGNIVDFTWSDSHSASPEFVKSIYANGDYNGNCGATTVGVSVNHSLYAMMMDWIKQVIPFHLSGMPIASRERTDVGWYRDFTSTQNTGIWDGSKYVSIGGKAGKAIAKSQGISDFEFYKNEDDPNFDMRATVREYVNKWCPENNCQPRFWWATNADNYAKWCNENGYEVNKQIYDAMKADETDGVYNQYYKVIADKVMYKPVFDENGNQIGEVPSPHKKIEAKFATDQPTLDMVFESENSMLRNREKNIDNANKYLDEMAYKAQQFLKGKISEEQMMNTNPEVFKNNADSDIYLQNKPMFHKKEGETVLEYAKRISDDMNVGKKNADYMKAVESGDTEKAGKLVAEVAKMKMPDTKVVDENGNPLVVYHGRRKDFYEFDTSDFGAYFNDNIEVANIYSSNETRPMSIYLDIKKPLVIDCKGKYWDEIEYDEYSDEPITTDNIVFVTKNNYSDTYDGVIFNNIIDGKGVVSNDYVAFDPNQIKSADPVTYDNNGKVIPLSERFSGKNDIRFAKKSNERNDFEGTLSDVFDGLRKKSLDMTYDEVINTVEDINNKTIKNSDVQVIVDEMRDAVSNFDMGDATDKWDDFVGEFESRVTNVINTNDTQENKTPTWEEAVALFRASTQHLRGGDDSQLSKSDDAKVLKNIEISNDLDKIIADINKKGAFDRRDLLANISNKLGGRINDGNDKYHIISLGDEFDMEIRTANHPANAVNFRINRKGNILSENYGVVIKEDSTLKDKGNGKRKRKSVFRKAEGVNYLEFSYDWDKIDYNKERQIALVNGVKSLVENGTIEDMPQPDKVHASGVFEKPLNDLRSQGAKFSKKQTTSQNFKNWFGDWEKDPENASKVVDENGEPLVVYHAGTFGKNGYVPYAENGMHFGTLKAAFERMQGDPPLYLIEKNEDGTFSYRYNIPDELMEYYPSKRGDGEKFASEDEIMEYLIEKEFGVPVTKAYLNIRNPKVVTDDDAQNAKAEGYDGYIYKNNVEDVGSESYVVFDPTQIKSATDNNGEFDGRNPDIRYSRKSSEGLYSNKLFDGFEPRLDLMNDAEISIMNNIAEDAIFNASKNKDGNKPKLANDYANALKEWYYQMGIDDRTNKPKEVDKVDVSDAVLELMKDRYTPNSFNEFRKRTSGKLRTALDDIWNKYRMETLLPYPNNQGAELHLKNNIRDFINSNSRSNNGDKTMFSKKVAKADPFYSNAAKAVEGIKQEKATPEQWLKMIEKAGGLKKGEDKWMGLSDWLKSQDKKSLTKDEVMQFIGENAIKIEEVKYVDSNSQEDYLDKLEAQYQGISDAFYFEDGISDPEWAILNDEKARDFYKSQTGIELPLNKNGYLLFNDQISILNWFNKKFAGDKPINPTRLSYTTEGLENNKEIALVVPTVEPYNANDMIHFGDAGNGRAVAWIRFGDAYTQSKEERVLENYGKKTLSELWALDPQLAKSLRNEDARRKPKVLVIDEIQSNRHQDGREKGYQNEDWRRQPAKKAWDLFSNSMREKYNIQSNGAFQGSLTPEEEAMRVKLWDEYSKENRERARMMMNDNNLVPDAPFDKNWQELAMKRMLRYAAENGYDKVAWTTGSQQADRYSLSQIVDNIFVMQLSDDTYNVIGYNNGEEVYDGGEMSKAEVINTIGKELSQKAFDNIANGDMQSTVLKGDDIKIGGDGMKGFYDRMLPSFMNKYGKKWGAKVEPLHIDGLKDKKSGYNVNGGLDFHSVDVTPEMSEGVMKGQPMFSKKSYQGIFSAREMLEMANGDPRTALTNTIQDLLSDDAVSGARKSELKNLLSKIKDVNNKKLRRYIDEADQIVTGMEIRSAQSELEKLLNTSVKKQNTQGLSEAKGVDEKTRLIIEGARGTLQNLMKSGIESDMTDIRRRIRAINEQLADEDLNSLTRGDLEEEKAELKSQLDGKKQQAMKLISEGIIDDASSLDNMRSELDSKYADFLDGNGEWSEEDSANYTAIQLRSMLANNRMRTETVNNIGNEIDAIERQLHELKSQRYKAKQAGDQNAVESLDASIFAMENALDSKNEALVNLQHSLYEDIKNTTNTIQNIMEDGRGNLRSAVEEELSRRRNIVSGTVKDLNFKGEIDRDALTKSKWYSRISDVLWSFEYMCKRLNKRTMSDDGYLYQKFILGSEGVMAAEESLAKGRQDFREAMDAKAKELFGMSAEDVIEQSESGKKLITVNKVVMEGGMPKLDMDGFEESRSKELTLGQAMYLYMVDKMADGRMKLRADGYGEEAMNTIREQLPQQYKDFADWMQEDLLVNLRDKYNETYKAMFNTSLANIENYVPLKIHPSALMEKGDLTSNQTNAGNIEAKTGSLINRTVNTLPVDDNMNAFRVVQGHVNDMEEWNAFARVRKDLNAILKSKYIRNVMNTMEGGLFDAFKTSIEYATHTEQSNFKTTGVNNLLGALQKGLTGGALNFRVWTAAKQITSYPAFLEYAQGDGKGAFILDLIKYLKSPKGNWDWAMKNLPVFKERVYSGDLGDTRLSEQPSSDKEIWQRISEMQDNVNKYGLYMNKMVDGLTCAAGARAVYNLTLKQKTKYYKALYGKMLETGALSEIGFNKFVQDKAEADARIAAQVAFNTSQQSSLGGFVSEVQKSKEPLARALTLFQNSNISYFRKVAESARDLYKMKDYKKMVDAYTKEYLDNGLGLTEQEARSMAISKVWSRSGQNLTRLAVFGLALQMIWDLAGNSVGQLYHWFGDDKDDSNNSYSIWNIVTMPFRGNQIARIIGDISNSKGDYNPMMWTQALTEWFKDFQTTKDNFGTTMACARTMLTLATKYMGVNMDTVTDWTNGMTRLIMGIQSGKYDETDLALFELMSLPKSQRLIYAKNKFRDDMSLEEYTRRIADVSKLIPINSSMDEYLAVMPGYKSLTDKNLAKIKKSYTTPDKGEEKEEEEDWVKMYKEKREAQPYMAKKIREEHPELKLQFDAADKEQSDKKLMNEYKEALKTNPVKAEEMKTANKDYKDKFKNAERAVNYENGARMFGNANDTIKMKELESLKTLASNKTKNSQIYKFKVKMYNMAMESFKKNPTKEKFERVRQKRDNMIEYLTNHK